MSENIIRYVIGPIMIVVLYSLATFLMIGASAISIPTMLFAVIAYLGYTYFTKTYKKK